MPSASEHSLKVVLERMRYYYPFFPAHAAGLGDEAYFLIEEASDFIPTWTGCSDNFHGSAVIEKLDPYILE